MIGESKGSHFLTCTFSSPFFPCSTSLPQQDYQVCTPDGDTIMCYHPTKDMAFKDSKVCCLNSISIYLHVYLQPFFSLSL